MTYLDNDAIRVGVDLERGGTIAYLSPTGGRNVINTYDLGREVQPSFYSGPVPFGNPQPPWEHVGWNPVASGDRYGHASKILSATNEGSTIYVKSRPMQWALNGVPCECTLEQWLTLGGNAVQVHTRLSIHRSDRRSYGDFTQELPAVYALGTLDRLVSYSGRHPYRGEPVETIEVPTEGVTWLATEHWAAWVNGKGEGLGVVQPDVERFTAKSVPGDSPGRSDSFATNYLSPNTPEALGPDETFELDYALVIGSANQVRAVARSLRQEAADGAGR